MKKKIIEFKDFSFQYRVQAEPTVKNINLTIYEGEKVLIVGLSLIHISEPTRLPTASRMPSSA